MLEERARRALLVVPEIGPGTLRLPYQLKMPLFIARGVVENSRPELFYLVVGGLVSVGDFVKTAYSKRIEYWGRGSGERLKMLSFDRMGACSEGTLVL